MRILLCVVAATFILCGVQCQGTGPSEAEIQLQQQVDRITQELATEEQRNTDLEAQLVTATESLQATTDPEQQAQIQRIIDEITATQATLKQEIEADQKQKELWEASLQVAEGARKAASADTNTIIQSVLGVIPPPWGTLGAAVFGVVAGISEAKRRKTEKKAAAAFTNLEKSSVKSGEVRTINSEKLRAKNGPELSAWIESLIQ